MNVLLFDPSPSRNDYLTRIYFEGLVARSGELGVSVTRIDSLAGITNSVILINGDHLDLETIHRLRNDGNKLIAFDINDNTLLAQSYRDNGLSDMPDLIFKVGGIQKFRVSQDLSVDEDFGISMMEREFLNEGAWEVYRQLDRQKMLLSLPYVPWGNQEWPSVPFGQRSGDVLIRGGCHIYRFLTFLSLCRAGRADCRSSFELHDYFREDMNQQFRFCDSCRSGGEGRDGCTSPAVWGGDKVTGLDRYENANHWNNRCPRSFEWLAKKFEEKHGSIVMDFVRGALAGKFDAEEDFFIHLSHATFYADLKWLFSIYCPPRFWEAANVGTINLLPSRTTEQEYFPNILVGKHYLTFREDFSQQWPVVDEEEFGLITGNARDLYEQWIRPGNATISSNLARHIFDQIEIAVS